MGLRVASIAGAIALWWLLSLAMPANLLPGPVTSTVTLFNDFAQGDVLPHLAITLLRVTGGLALAMLIGVPVGILMGINQRAEKVLDIWVMVGLTVPSLCYAIICFILIGLNEAATIAAIGLTAAPSIAINLWEGVKTIDFKLVQMARIFEVGRARILLRVLLPYLQRNADHVVALLLQQCRRNRAIHAATHRGDDCSLACLTHNASLSHNLVIAGVAV